MDATAWTWAQTARRRTVEVLAYWRGRINTTELMSRFGISRQAALQDIHAYQEAAPGRLIYRPSLKVYEPSAAFRLEFSRGVIDEWLELEPNLSVEIERPRFELGPELVRPFGEAVRGGLGVDAIYRSLNHPDGSRRRLYPHTLVYTGFRWHARAWCAKREEFRDFTLARVAGAELLDTPRPEAADPANDRAWQARVALRLAANPRLPDPERGLIEAEFGMRGEVLAVPCRGALVPYTLQIYQVDPRAAEAVDANPRQHRLVLENLDEVRPWLWGSAAATDGK
jgi:hypothetical protein